MVALPAHKGPSSEARLRTLGLKLPWLVDAIMASEIERRSCNPLEPSSAPGFKAWVALFTTLAQTLIPQRWVRVEDHNLPRLVNPGSAIAIAVCHGNESVGLLGHEPKSKYPRGDASILLVRSNKRQLSLFPDQSVDQPIPPAVEQITWWLLVYSGPGGTLRAELSLPVAVEDDRLSQWQERIIIEIPSVDVPGAPPEDEDAAFEVDVTVRSRT